MVPHDVLLVRPGDIRPEPCKRCATGSAVEEDHRVGGRVGARALEDGHRQLDLRAVGPRPVLRDNQVAAADVLAINDSLTKRELARDAFKAWERGLGQRWCSTRQPREEEDGKEG